MSSNKVPDSSWIKRIEEAISKNHFKRYDYKNFNDINEISSGSFGKVYSANYKTTHKQVLLKSFISLNNAVVEEILYEFKLQREIDFHDNVYLYGVTISDFDNSSRNYMLVMEYADGGTLQDYLKKNFNNLTWNDKLILALQLACVVARLHDEGIAHRDLHDCSLLVHRNSIKLADFGLSRRIDKTSTGVIPYVEPKRFNKQNNSTQIYSLNVKSDVYSVGVLLWELSSGRPPFIDNKSYDDNLAAEILQGLRETVISNTPDDYVKLYTECWDSNPGNRPSMSEVVRRLKTIISQTSQTSVKFYQQPKENLNDITTTKNHGRRFNNKMNVDNPFESGIVYKLVDNIFKLINEGNESEIKKYLIDYIGNDNINLQMICSQIIENEDKSDKSNLTFLLGSIYYFGVRIGIDFEKAFHLFTVSANSGHLLAQYFIGLCYESGNGITKDVITAFKYYKKIAEVNCAVGEFKVGFFYDEGIGIKKDSKIAAYWYEKAANNGNLVARYTLAKMYKNGDGIDKDFGKAFDLFKQLAEKDPKGILMLENCQKALGLYQKSASLEKSVA